MQAKIQNKTLVPSFEGFILSKNRRKILSETAIHLILQFIPFLVDYMYKHRKAEQSKS